jgi:hypothetical protein
VATVRDIGLVNVNVAGFYEAAALVGVNFGTVSNAFITGTVTAVGPGSAAGLVAVNSGTVTNSRVNVTVTALNGGNNVGALVGFNSNTGIVSNSIAEGLVQAAGQTTPGGGLVFSAGIGGLVGTNFGIVSGSQANVKVDTTDSENVGGLVGNNVNLNIPGFDTPGMIVNSSASGSVTAFFTNSQLVGQTGFGVGGLVGANDGSIAGSSANVNVTVGATPDSGAIGVGGLVGFNGVLGTIDNSPAGGNVVTFGNVLDVGGIVGTNFGGDGAGVSNSPFNGAVNGVGPGADAAAARAAAAQAAALQAQVAAARAGVIQQGAGAANVTMKDAQTSSATSPNPAASSAAGTRATAALASPKIDDNLKIEEPPPAPEEEQPRARRRVVTAAPTARRASTPRRSPGYGATIRSIDIDGQHLDLHNGGASRQKVQ